MEQQKILQSDYLDILYDHRNKKYGGYELRKKYQSRAGKAVSGVLIFTFIVAAIPVIAGMNERPVRSGGIIVKPVVTNITDVHTRVMPPKPVAPAHANTPAPTARTVAIPTIIRPTVEVVDVPKPVEKDAISGAKNGDGRTDVLVAGTGTLDSKGTGPDPVTTTGVEISGPAEPIMMPDESPMFNGDVAAFLSSHLNYPESAREASIEGRVVLKFVVAEDGSITNVEVARGVDRNLDAEAMRVVKSMPKWKPGRVKGKAVKVYFSLPITFRLD